MLTNIQDILRDLGLKRIAQAMIIAVNRVKHLKVPSRPKRFSKNSVKYGIIVVNTELPAVTMPLTSPKYFLK